MISSSWKRDLVLVGGGHAHVLAMRMLAMKPMAGVRLSLVSPDNFTPYSGMLPGLVAGHYSHEHIHIDLNRFCARLGVRFIRARADGIDLGKQRILLAGRAPLSFDVLSFDIGSQPGAEQVAGALDYGVPVKPVASFYQRWLRVVEAVVQVTTDTPKHLAVVGGGAGSVELALAMAHTLPKKAVRISLVCGTTLLNEYHQRTRHVVRRHCSELGIVIRERAPVVSVTDNSLQLEDGSELAYDEVFWCTQAAGASWLAESGLTCDESGFLQVRDTLQLLDQDNLFAAGDVASQVNHPRPKAGVFAVRQAPVLARNLAAYLAGDMLKDYRPQRKFLSMLSLGDRQAVAEKGLFRASGAWVWRWKNQIDSRFMRKFEDLPATMPTPATADPPEMHCGGCGAKLPGSNLQAVLAELGKEYPTVVDIQNLADDASSLNIPAAGVIFQSVDVLRALIDDPWLMGRLAVLHALSDLHAMGAKPYSVLSHICLPYASRRMQESELYAILSGACFELQREGAVLSGGHTLEGPELSIGFTVNGLAEEGVLQKSDVRAGDQLILCKPLGTGVLFAAQQQGLARGEWISSALEFMLQSNAAAAGLARQHQLIAATDITGFGLLGHLAEMLGESGLQARIDVNSVPVLDGVSDCYAQGVASTLQPGNQALVAELLPFDSAPDAPQLQPMFDPQTSGGLLFAVSAERSEGFLLALRQQGYSRAAVVGELAASDSPGYSFN